MQAPVFSVIIPARNESERLPSTLASIDAARSSTSAVEYIVVDDASTDVGAAELDARCRTALPGDACVRVLRSTRHLGIPAARNFGAAHARGEIFFITDAHVHVSTHWDRHALASLRPNRAVCAAVADVASAFRGYGCWLELPSMGVRWRREPIDAGVAVPVGPCGGTILPARLFRGNGGYDEGMPLYGAAEPEFSVRLWLSGGEIVMDPAIVVYHRFRDGAARARFKLEHYSTLLHNYVRFGLLYLEPPAAFEMLRYHARTSPAVMAAALQMIDRSDVWEVRRRLAKRFVRTLDWYLEFFGIGSPTPDAISG